MRRFAQAVQGSAPRSSPLASAFGDIKIMLPLVTTVDGSRAKALVEVQRCERRRGRSLQQGHRGRNRRRDCILIANKAGSWCDFFSINQRRYWCGYTMCADRGNDRILQYQPPSSSSSARVTRKKIMVVMCGATAADPLLIPVLLSFGLDGFSVSCTICPAHPQKTIAAWTKELGERALLSRHGERYRS